jgi:predicted nuclease of predicted toxin-antitoxin system
VDFWRWGLNNYLWVTCGNVTNRRLQNLLTQEFPRAQELLASGEAVVELADLETLPIRLAPKTTTCRVLPFS